MLHTFTVVVLKLRESSQPMPFNNQFGYSVSISLNRAIVGSRDKHTGSGRNGGVYIFDMDQAGNWTETYNLVDPNGNNNDRFGASVSISANNMFAGAPEATPGASASSGVLFNLVDPSIVKDKIATVSNGELQDPTVKSCNCILPEENAELEVKTAVVSTEPLALAQSVDIKVDVGGSMDLAGNPLDAKGAFDNKGTVTNGVVKINGTTQQIVNLGTLDAVEIDNSAGVKLSDDATIKEVLYLENGILDTDGKKIVLSSMLQNSMVVDNGGTISGTVTAQKYLSGDNGWHYVTSPGKHNYC